MDLAKLSKTTEKKLRRLGQGHGSGRGKTAGRGTKGQKARGKIKPFFEGGALPLSKRIPFLRGRGRNKGLGKAHFVITVERLNTFRSGSSVDLESVIKSGLVPQDAKKHGVKIIGNGELKVSLTVKVPTSSGAKKIIEKAGGQVDAAPSPIQA